MPLQIKMRPGYDVGAVTQAIRANCSRGLRSPRAGAYSGEIQVAGSGPSLREVLPLGDIAACNNAWRTIADTGSIPKFIICADPRIENAEWFKGAPENATYLIASRCHPKVFDVLSGKRVLIWHVASEEEASLGLRDLIDGGSTIITKALNLLSFMGFERFKLFGCESCYALDGSHHASPQRWHDREERRPFQVGDRMFVAAPWMAAQAAEIVEHISAHRFDQHIEVLCGGLTSALLEEATLNLIYDLDKAPASYDFISWMFNIESYRQITGHKLVKVRFRSQGKDYEPQDLPAERIAAKPLRRQELANGVCRPALRLFGAKEGGSGPSAVDMTYVIRPTVDHFHAGVPLPEMRASAEMMSLFRPGDRSAFTVRDRYVITLREATHWPSRNSNFDAWMHFAIQLRADGLDVIVVRDTAKANDAIEGVEICAMASMALDVRLALYRSAKMNFFVSNGPCVLATYTSDIPYLCFMKSPHDYPCHAPNWVEQHMGIPYGGQFPWATERQRLVWADDTPENIAEAWAEMKGFL
jgi:hypothetical protein